MAGSSALARTQGQLLLISLSMPGPSAACLFKKQLYEQRQKLENLQIILSLSTTTPVWCWIELMFWLPIRYLQGLRMLQVRHVLMASRLRTRLVEGARG